MCSNTPPVLLRILLFLSVFASPLQARDEENPAYYTRCHWHVARVGSVLTATIDAELYLGDRDANVVTNLHSVEVTEEWEDSRGILYLRPQPLLLNGVPVYDAAIFWNPRTRLAQLLGATRGFPQSLKSRYQILDEETPWEAKSKSLFDPDIAAQAIGKAVSSLNKATGLDAGSSGFQFVSSDSQYETIPELRNRQEPLARSDTPGFKSLGSEDFFPLFLPPETPEPEKAFMELMKKLGILWAGRIEIGSNPVGQTTFDAHSMDESQQAEQLTGLFLRYWYTLHNGTHHYVIETTEQGDQLQNRYTYSFHFLRPRSAQ